MIEIHTEFGKITLLDNVLANAENADGQDIELTISHADSSALPEEVRSQIGNRPVLDF